MAANAWSGEELPHTSRYGAIIKCHMGASLPLQHFLWQLQDGSCPKDHTLKTVRLVSRRWKGQAQACDVRSWQVPSGANGQQAHGLRAECLRMRLLLPPACPQRLQPAITPQYFSSTLPLTYIVPKLRYAMLLCQLAMVISAMLHWSGSKSFKALFVTENDNILRLTRNRS